MTTLDTTIPFLAAMPTWFYQHVPSVVFVFAFGACLGSFLNVVVFRVPDGVSVVSPPSRCPFCARMLPWYENLPILGWLLLRGRCRGCGVRISPRYVFIELGVAVLVVFIYLGLYTQHPTAGGWPLALNEWWFRNGFLGNWPTTFGTWPAFFSLIGLLGGLYAMTVIDARTFLIPLPIPLAVTAAAFVLAIVQALLPLSPFTADLWPIPTVGWAGSGAAAGGMLGVLLSWALLETGVLKPSFADYEEYEPEDTREEDLFVQYPHARREMGVELLFLLPCLVGIAAGYSLGGLAGAGTPPLLVSALGAAMLGYLVGGGLIWGVRILGTLAVGREAMGLGDVHLLGAVGAVLGWRDPISVFFIAPFFGIGWALLSVGLGSMFKLVNRALPYGPLLALATVLVIGARPVMEAVTGFLFNGFAILAQPLSPAYFVYGLLGLGVVLLGLVRLGCRSSATAAGS